jgi:osmotically-inducible protein OsmY
MAASGSYVSAMPPQPALQESPAPDNTKTNKRDRDKDAVTADSQKENRSDRELARKIRSAITADKGLSMYAHNIKVVVQNGAVTLKGPVRTDDEKKALESKAAGIAGDSKVTSEIEVKPKQ